MLLDGNEVLNGLNGNRQVCNHNIACYAYSVREARTQVTRQRQQTAAMFE